MSSDVACVRASSDDGGNVYSLYAVIARCPNEGLDNFDNDTETKVFDNSTEDGFFEKIIVSDLSDGTTYLNEKIYECNNPNATDSGAVKRWRQLYASESLNVGYIRNLERYLSTGSGSVGFEVNLRHVVPDADVSPRICPRMMTEIMCCDNNFPCSYAMHHKRQSKAPDFIKQCDYVFENLALSADFTFAEHWGEPDLPAMYPSTTSMTTYLPTSVKCQIHYNILPDKLYNRHVFKTLMSLDHGYKVASRGYDNFVCAENSHSLRCDIQLLCAPNTVYTRVTNTTSQQGKSAGVDMAHGHCMKPKLIAIAVTVEDTFEQRDNIGRKAVESMLKQNILTADGVIELTIDKTNYTWLYGPLHSLNEYGINPFANSIKFEIFKLVPYKDWRLLNVTVCYDSTRLLDLWYTDGTHFEYFRRSLKVNPFTSMYDFCESVNPPDGHNTILLSSTREKLENGNNGSVKSDVDLRNTAALTDVVDATLVSCWLGAISAVAGLKP